MDFAQEFVARPLKRAYSAGWHLANPTRIASGEFRSRHVQLSGAERHRRSDSGAAVRLTRGEELGCALGGAIFRSLSSGAATP